MTDSEILATGHHRFRFLHTPQVPHGWDAGLLFEETQSVLLCSDLFHQNGDVKAVAGLCCLHRHRSAQSPRRACGLALFGTRDLNSPASAAYSRRLPYQERQTHSNRI